MEYIRTVLTYNLISLREGRGLNGSQFAKLVGIGQSTYSRYESSGWIPDSEILEKIADFYGIKSTRLFYDPSLDTAEIQKTYVSPPDADEIIKNLQEIIQKLTH